MRSLALFLGLLAVGSCAPLAEHETAAVETSDNDIRGMDGVCEVSFGVPLCRDHPYLYCSHYIPLHKRECVVRVRVLFCCICTLLQLCFSPSCEDKVVSL
ncbi:hypothetical protein DPMN_042839 [Dreissena polymorpha]|uniref:Uncharacterized protein n=1 Tax=Dreissena polymorpha TaxID=45954 RepID=A0A9D4CZC0_DREPO|nr:hypothetical protein DPMN_042839 [Dreissena polymorpha]